MPILGDASIKVGTNKLIQRTAKSVAPFAKKTQKPRHFCLPLIKTLGGYITTTHQVQSVFTKILFMWPLNRTKSNFGLFKITDIF